MKIRSRFISNSSTSSFVVIGWEVKENEISEEQAEKVGLDFYDTESMEEGEALIGEEINCWDEECEIKEVKNLEKIIKEVKESGKKLGIKKEPSLFSGVRLS